MAGSPSSSGVRGRRPGVGADAVAADPDAVSALTQDRGLTDRMGQLNTRGWVGSGGGAGERPPAPVARAPRPCGADCQTRAGAAPGGPSPGAGAGATGSATRRRADSGRSGTGARRPPATAAGPRSGPVGRAMTRAAPATRRRAWPGSVRSRDGLLTDVGRDPPERARGLRSTRRGCVRAGAGGDDGPPGTIDGRTIDPESGVPPPAADRSARASGPLGHRPAGRRQPCGRAGPDR